MDINNKKEIGEINEMKGSLYKKRPLFRIWAPKSKRMVYSQDIANLNSKEKSATLLNGEVVDLDEANWMMEVPDVGIDLTSVYQGDILMVTGLASDETPSIFYVRVGDLSCGGFMTCPPFGENGDPTFLENETPDGAIYTSDLMDFDIVVAGNIFEMDDSCTRRILRCEKRWQRIQDEQFAERRKGEE